MPSLLELQRAVARGVLSGDFAGVALHVLADGIPAGNRLGIYRNTARLGVTRALRSAFPAIDALTGPDFFDMAASRYFHAEPPDRACLDEYGGGFPAFLQALPEVGGVAYLADVGRLEWALGRAARAPDAPVCEAGELALVPEHLRASLRLRAHPSVAWLRLTFPADRIVAAVLAADDAVLASLDLDDGPIGLIVHRGRSGLETERVPVRAMPFLERLFTGTRLGQLLEMDASDAPALIAAQFAAGRIASVEIGTPE